VLAPDPNGAVVHLVPGDLTLRASVPPSATASALLDEDPERVVKAFVEQNQKLAETQLKNLNDEAEKLRTRLHKVEAGIKRWETLHEALKQSQVVTSVTAPATAITVVEPGLPPSTDLEPISVPNSPGQKARPKASKPALDRTDPRLPPG